MKHVIVVVIAQIIKMTITVIQTRIMEIFLIINPILIDSIVPNILFS